MYGKEQGIVQPPDDSLAAPRHVNISPVILPMEYRTPQHAVQSLQHQTQMPANVTANGLPSRHFPAYHTQWQAKQTYLQSNQTGHGPPLASPSGLSRPPRATAATVPFVSTARLPPQSAIHVGDNNISLNVPTSQPDPGISVAQPRTVAEFLSLNRNNASRPAGHTASIPNMQNNPINSHQQDQQILQRQQLVREYQQQQLQQQQKQPLPPQQQQQPPQQQLRQEYMKRPQPIPHAPSFPSRPPPPLPFLNDVPPAGHPQLNKNHGIAPQLNNNNNHDIAPRLQLPQPVQRPVFTAAPIAPSPPPMVQNHLPETHPTGAVDLVAATAAPDFLLPDLDVAGLTPSFEDIELPLDVPLELTDALPSEEFPHSHIVGANQHIGSLQAEQAQHMQQEVMESIRNLPIPMEIQQQINAGAGAVVALPTAADKDAALPMAADEAPRAAIGQVSEEERDASLTSEEARQQKLRKEKQRHRREQQTENKRKQRQRYKDEEEAGWNAVVQALEAAQNELAHLRLNSTRLTLSIALNARVMVVRNAMLKVFYLEEKKGIRGFAREDQVREKLLGSSVVPTPEIVAVKEIHPIAEPSDTVTATAVAAEEKGKEDKQERPSSPPSPSPMVPPQSTPLQLPNPQQLNTFEIAESLAHTEIDACLSYTRQFLIDVKLSVEEAFDENLPPELVASIENSVKKGRSVYKRVLEERKDIYYSHVCRLSENAIMGAAKTKEAAALLLNRGISTAQLLKLKDMFRNFQDDDTLARDKLVQSQMEVNQLLKTLGNTMNIASSAAGGVCHAIQAGHHVEVTACVQKWEHFSNMRQNFMVQLEELFFQVRLSVHHG